MLLLFIAYFNVTWVYRTIVHISSSDHNANIFVINTPYVGHNPCPKSLSRSKYVAMMVSLYPCPYIFLMSIRTKVVNFYVQDRTNYLTFTIITLVGNSGVTPESKNAYIVFGILLVIIARMMPNSKHFKTQYCEKSSV